MKRVGAWLRTHGLPKTLFGRLAWLLVIAVLLSHLLARQLVLEVGADLFRPATPPEGSGMLHWVYWMEIGIRLSALIVAAWVGAHWLAQPVRRLAQAAQALGHDIHSTPLRESGTLESREATRVFNAMQVQICKQLHERDRFVAAVSHDLRTPLTRMALRAENLPTPALRAQFGRDIGEMNSMIAATLDYLRGVAQAEPLVLLDLDSMLCSLADDYAACGHAVVVEHPNGVPLCAPHTTQAQALRRCVGHLVNSAMRYGGGARIRSFDHGTQLSIEVRDDGPGVRDVKLETLRLPWLWAERSRHRQGADMGWELSIASDMALRLSGELHLDNRPEGGLTATLVLQRQR